MPIVQMDKLKQHDFHLFLLPIIKVCGSSQQQMQPKKSFKFRFKFWHTGPVPHFLLCPRKIPQAGHKQLLNKQQCFENCHYRRLFFSSSLLFVFFFQLLFLTVCNSAPVILNKLCLIPTELRVCFGLQTGLKLRGTTKYTADQRERNTRTQTASRNPTLDSMCHGCT